MGLLDSLDEASGGLLSSLKGIQFKPDPMGLALLNAGAQMAQASGPSRTPVGFGQILGAGAGGMAQGLQQAQEMKHQQMLLDMQQAKSDMLQRQMNAYQNINMSDPNAVNQLMQAGAPDAAIRLYTAQNPSKTESQYTDTFVGADGRTYLKNHRETDPNKFLTPLFDNQGNPIRAGNLDPITQANIAKGKEGQKVTEIITPDGKVKKVPANYLPGFSDLSSTGSQQQGNIPKNSQTIPQNVPDPNVVQKLRDAGQDAAADSYIALFNPKGPLPNELKGANVPVIQQGQTTYDKANSQELGKTTAENQAALNQQIQMYDNVIKQMSEGIDLLNPKTDKLTNKVIYDVNTGGMFPGVQKWINEDIVNDPKLQKLTQIGSTGALQQAQTFLKGQGSVSDAERALINQSTGMDPYKFNSDQLYQKYTETIKMAERLKKIAMEKAKGNYAPITESHVDDLVNHYLGN